MSDTTEEEEELQPPFSHSLDLDLKTDFSVKKVKLLVI